ncbi:MAG: hypothetical protein M1483_03560 [Actinobacteria bacterium]|nr:hypothetical protein [Actinomycetota bacterium]MCL6104700.1 hypothetical protein [Actinomycetota bacterium]
MRATASVTVHRRERRLRRRKQQRKQQYILWLGILVIAAVFSLTVVVLILKP